MKKKVQWISVFGHECKDEPAEEAVNYDATFEVLVVDGEMVAAGDYYHDKIGDYIAGFLDCLNREHEMDFTGEDVVISLKDSWAGVHIPEEKEILFRAIRSTKYDPWER